MSEEGEYPIGAFVVANRQSLGPLVARLRQMNRLKPGMNVTPLNVYAMRRVEAPATVRASTTACEGESSPRLCGAWVEVSEFEASAQRGDKHGCSRHRLSIASFPDRTPQATTPALEAFFASLSPSPLASAESTDRYMAVHTTGRWSEEALLALLCPTNEAHAVTSHRPQDGNAQSRDSEVSQSPVVTPPIAFIHQLRCYSCACCPVSALPAPLAAMRAAAAAACGACRTTVSSASSARTSPYTFAELFGGIGMFRLGLERAGAVPVFAVEFAAPACAVYDANFHTRGPAESGAPPAVPLAGDITEIPDAFFPPHDILTAGFPCQSFSKAGPAGGLHDAKGWLFHEVVRVLRATRPRAFLLENVENLLAVEEGEQLRVIRQWLQHPRTGGGDDTYLCATETAHEHDALSYTVHQEVLDGAAVTPQKRRRVYFLGVRSDLLAAAKPPSGASAANDSQTCEENVLRDVFATAHQHLSTMREVSRSTGVAASSPWYRPEARYGCVRDLLDPRLPPRAPLTDQTNEGTPSLRLRSLRLSRVQWEAVRRSKKFRAHPDWRLAELDGNARTLMGSYRTSFQLYSEFVPLYETPRASVTLAATTDGDTDESAREDAPCRFYSVRECARLQGIPEHFTFLHDEGAEPTHDEHAGGPHRAVTKRLPVGAAYKLVGNAVNPLVIECIGVSLINFLSQLDGGR